MARLPYVGLRPYQKTEGTFFSGRQGEISVLYDIYQEQAADKGKLLIIYGPSGSGKTSIVQAGLWPLARVSKDVAHLERFEPAHRETLPAFGQRVRQYVGRQSGTAADRPLVFVDQLDQVFDYPLDGKLDETSRDILAKLLEFLVQATQRGIARVIIAVREPWSTFLEQASNNPQFAEKHLGFFRLQFLSSSGLDEFLRAPIERWLKSDRPDLNTPGSKLFHEFYGELNANPTSLPHANFMLEKLVVRGEADKFSEASLKQPGGLIGFMTAQAEEAYKSWPAEIQEKLEVFIELFRAAVTEESPDGVRSCEAKPLVADPDSRDILALFMAARLVTLKGDRWDQVEAQVAHDQLFEVWPRTAREDSIATLAAQQAAKDGEDKSVAGAA